MVDFLKYRIISVFISLAILGSFVGGIVYKRQTRGSAFVYSVDFTGGTQVLLGFSQKASSSDVDAILEKNGFEGVVTREFSPTEILVRVKGHEASAEGLAGKMKETLEESLEDTEITIKQTDSVGPGVGEILRWKSLQAIIVALALMLLYIWFRFWSFSFAMGSVISLTHDVLIILTFILWFDYEISLNIIGAVLFILGYSINDTIVIFSRIRENINKLHDKTIKEVINLSINQTLRRTILTSLATCLVVVALLLFGGEALRTLSLALLIGITFGTYSSIYIASPVMLMLYRK